MDTDYVICFLHLYVPFSFMIALTKKFEHNGNEINCYSS